jgi:hypothetical protein
LSQVLDSDGKVAVEALLVVRRRYFIVVPRLLSTAPFVVRCRY